MSNLLKHLQQENDEKAHYQQTLDYALAYLASVRHRPVFPSDAAIDGMRALDLALPRGTKRRCRYSASVTRDRFAGHGRPRRRPLFRLCQRRRYFQAALAARILADVWDQNAALNIMSPIAAKLEAICETWLVDLLDLPADTAAGFVSGTSTATLCGLLAGRNAILSRQGWDVGERGLFGAPVIRLVMSEAAHGSVRKALALLGSGQAQIEIVPADDQGRMDTQDLPKLDDSTLLILQAGNVNSGAFDDFVTICLAAERADSWVHIDGAFGLWARACSTTVHLTAGIEIADSWSVDAHKTLNSAYDCGIILCKDRQALVQALQAQGAYLQFGEERDGMLYTPEMSRRARGIELWALLKSLGRAGVDELGRATLRAGAPVCR